MNKIGRKFLESTDGGLKIFEKYMEHDFEVNDRVKFNENSWSFIVKWADRYGNYAVYLFEKVGSKWEKFAGWNAIWFMKNKFDLTEDEVYQKLDREMGLGILQPKQTINL